MVVRDKILENGIELSCKVLQFNSRSYTHYGLS